MTLGERKQTARDALTRTREDLLQLVGQLQPDDWYKPVQTTDGGWTAKQMLLHIATSETGQTSTGRAIAADQPTVPDDFDLNRYNNRQIEKNKDKQPPEILLGMAEGRQKLLTFLEEVPEDALDKRGKHARGDIISLEHLFRRIAEHEAEHTAQIKAALGK
jgi:uncharacterized damage-inducible protein DinB